MRADKNHFLFIGMGDWYLPQLDLARDYGYQTIVTNRQADAQALKHADVPLVVDGRDIYTILARLNELGLGDQVAYVYTGTELFTTAAMIARSLNVPWHAPLAANVCENKSLMRGVFGAKDIPHPVGLSARTLDDITGFISWNGEKRYIIKPSDGLSALGVTIVDSEEQLPGAVKAALEVSTSKTVVCEEYIEGTLHDTNGILTEEGLLRMGTSDKTAGPPPYAVVVEGRAPSILSPEKQEELYQLFDKACRAVGLGPGPVKGDFIMDRAGKFYCMEVAPRLHGPLGSIFLIPNALHIKPFEELLHWVNGEAVRSHDVGKAYQGKVYFQAADSPDEAQGKGQIIAVMEKPGIRDKAQWKSNNDVPVYVIWSES